MATKPYILVADTNRSNLEVISAVLAKEGYMTTGVASLEEMDKALDEQESIGLAVVDITGFETGIWKRCEQLRKKKIPFVVLSNRDSQLIREAGISRGSCGFFVKPLRIKEFLALVSSLLGGRMIPG